jgi:hypothetical protein
MKREVGEAMNLPAIPTDNLYKFMTVLGIVMIVFAQWSWTTSFTDTSVALAEIQARSENLRLNHRWNQEDSARLQAAWAAAKKDLPPLEQENLWTAEMKRIDLAQQAVMKEQQDIYRTLEIESAKVDNLTINMWKVMYYFGFVLTIVGAVFWYWNYQRFQDMLVRKQAESADPSKSGQESVNAGTLG